MLDLNATLTDPVSAKLAALAQAAGEVQATVIKALGDRYVLALKEETPRGQGEEPGGLVGAYQVEENYTQNSALYRITNTTPYLRYVLNGRGPVEAHAGHMLRFVIDGEVFFRKRVGPAAANDFPSRAAVQMQGAIAEARQTFPGLIVRAIK